MRVRFDILRIWSAVHPGVAARLYRELNLPLLSVPRSNHVHSSWQWLGPGKSATSGIVLVHGASQATAHTEEPSPWPEKLHHWSCKTFRHLLAT